MQNLEIGKKYLVATFPYGLTKWTECVFTEERIKTDITNHLLFFSDSRFCYPVLFEDLKNRVKPIN
jgi:hypothetical protein